MVRGDVCVAVGAVAETRGSMTRLDQRRPVIVLLIIRIVRIINTIHVIRIIVRRIIVTVHVI